MGTKPGVAARLLLTGAGPAEVPEHPVSLGMFTSGGCSSRPPANALLNELTGRPDLLPLAFHITYSNITRWSGLGWRDPYSLKAATAHQHAYAATLEQDAVYTPELIVDGRRGVVGPDRAAVAAAATEALRGPSSVAASLRGYRTGLSVDGGGGTGTIWLVGFDRQHQTAVGRGENGSHTLLESIIVRSIRQIGARLGTSLHLNTEPAMGEGVASLLQASDGHILVVARLEGDGL